MTKSCIPIDSFLSRHTPFRGYRQTLKAMLLTGSLVSAPPVGAASFDGHPKLVVHVTAPVAKNQCVSGALPDCAGAVTASGLYPAEPTRFAYLLVAKGTLPSIGGTQFGITYQGGAPGGALDAQGIDVLDWNSCSSLQFPAASWPSPGSGNLVTWGGGDCQEQDTSVIGFITLTAYGPDTLRITPRPVDAAAKVATCRTNTGTGGGTGDGGGIGDIPTNLDGIGLASVSGGAETRLEDSDLGFAVFSASGYVPGCNPCLEDCFAVPPPCIPDPGLSSVDPWDSYGQAFVSPGTQSGVDATTITILCPAGPVTGALVTVEFIGCDDLCFYGGDHLITGTTDGSGTFVFDPRVGGCDDCVVRITVDGIVIREFTKVVSPDWDGAAADGLVNTADADWVTPHIVAGTSEPCADYDGSGTVGSYDATLFSLAYNAGDSQPGCADLPCACYVWQQQFQNGPTVRMGHMASYDPNLDRIVLFGGHDGAAVLGDTWTWNGSGWSQMSPVTSPGPRVFGSMEFHAGLGAVVLFGGVDGSGTFLNDTWTWNGSNWVALNPPTAPGPRYAAGTAYDPGRDVLVLHGGNAATGRYPDTWEFDGTDWTEVTTTPSPGYLSKEAMTYSPGDGLIHLIGGEAPGNVPQNHHWTWNGTTWTNLGNAPFTPRTYPSAVPSPACGGILVFGGENGATVYDEVFAYEGGTWSQVPLDDTPGPRSRVPVSYRPAQNQYVLVGGYNGVTALSSGWHFLTDPCACEVPPLCDAGGDANSEYTGAAGVAIQFDGSGSLDPDGDPLAFAWSFGDGGVGSGPMPTHSYTNPGCYGVTLTVTDSCGYQSTCGAVAVVCDSALAVGGVAATAAKGPYLTPTGVGSVGRLYNRRLRLKRFRFRDPGDIIGRGDQVVMWDALPVAGIADHVQVGAYPPTLKSPIKVGRSRKDSTTKTKRRCNEPACTYKESTDDDDCRWFYPYRRENTIFWDWAHDGKFCSNGSMELIVDWFDWDRSWKEGLKELAKALADIIQCIGIGQNVTASTSACLKLPGQLLTAFIALVGDNYNGKKDRIGTYDNVDAGVDFASPPINGTATVTSCTQVDIEVNEKKPKITPPAKAELEWRITSENISVTIGNKYCQTCKPGDGLTDLAAAPTVNDLIYFTYGQRKSREIRVQAEVGGSDTELEILDAALHPGTREFLFAFDSDNDPATGDPTYPLCGADYYFSLIVDSDGSEATIDTELYCWTGLDNCCTQGYGWILQPGDAYDIHVGYRSMFATVPLKWIGDPQGVISAWVVEQFDGVVLSTLPDQVCDERMQIDTADNDDECPEIVGVDASDVQDGKWDSPITVTFSEPMAPITTADIQITPPVAFGVSQDLSGKILTITPSPAFAAGPNTVTLLPTISDEAGNFLSGNPYDLECGSPADVEFCVADTTFFASDAGGVPTDEFLPGEAVYAAGTGFVPGATFDLYIVPADDAVIDAITLVDQSHDGPETASAPGGVLTVTNLGQPLKPMEYTVVADLDQDGVLQLGIDRVMDACGYGFAVEGCVYDITSPAAWWPLDETGGDHSADLISGNHGAHVGSPVSVGGRVVNALEFDGSEYVEVPDADDLDAYDLDFSAALWVMPTVTTGTRSLLDKLPSGQPGFALRLVNGYPQLELRDSSVHLVATAPVSVPAGTWSHLAVVVQRETSGGIRFYIDGAQVYAQSSFMAGGDLENAAPLWIAGGRTGPSDRFVGRLDEVVLFEDILPPDDLLALYVAGTRGDPCPEPVVIEPDTTCCVTPPPGVVAWYPGVADPAEAVDLVGLQDPGAFVGATASYTTGIVGTAFDLDGSGTIQAPDAIKLGFTNTLSVEGWIRTTDVAAGEHDIVRKRQAGAGYALFVDAGAIGFLAQGSSNTTSGTGPFVADGVWHHVALTAGAGTARLYVDGFQVATHAYGAALGYVGNAEPLILGGGWIGSLDEITLYNSLLSAGDVAAVYAAREAGKCLEFAYLPRSRQCVAGGSTAVDPVLCNFTAYPREYSWVMENVGGSSLSFIPNQGSVLVGPGSSVRLSAVQVTCPPGTLPGTTAAYKLSTYNLDPATGIVQTDSCLFADAGEVVTTRGYFDVSWSTAFASLTFGPGDTITASSPVSILVGNTQPGALTFDYRVSGVAAGTPGAFSPYVSVGGLGPGTPVTGSVVIPGQGSALIPVGVQLLTGAGIGLFDLVLEWDVDGDLSLEPGSAIPLSATGTPQTVSLPDDRPPVSGRIQAAPNPFRSGTQVYFTMETRGSASVQVVDVMGREVRTLFQGVLEPGQHRQAWDGRNDHGSRVASGLYFVKLEASGETRVTRVVALP